ncbi:MAG TPA: Ig-like domain-containing protein [Bryobacteraceae bacterium]|nr:Ig-like domain-containing protein [Bryobacteraceae bacterium]
MTLNRWAKLAALAMALGAGARAQLNQNCIVSVLNRNVQVNADGTWVLPNVPAGYGPVRARATCVQNGITSSGESDFFTVAANGAQNLPAITLGAATPIPASLTLTAPPTPLTAAGQTLQLTVTATYPDNTTRDVSAAAAGTAYTSSNPAIATISAAGLLTAVSTGRVVIQATNEGASGIASFQVTLGGVSHNGIPDSWALANGLNPLDPTLALEDPDRDGLTNLQEFQLGTNPTNPDTDGDGLRDGDEVNLYHTNPLLADSDGDLIPDGVEVTNGTDPLNPASYDLKKAAASSVLQPASFVLTTSALVPNASIQLSWKVALIDGKTTLDLTADPRTNYISSDVTICNFGTPKGMVFAANTGACVITISQNTLSMTATGAVQSFTPKTLSFVAIPGFANNVKVNGNYAYVAAGSAGLQVVDVTDRTSPRVVSSLGLPSNANDLRIRGSMLYMAANSGLLVIDITNPLSPKLLGSLSTPGVAWDVTLAGNLAYIADGASGLQIADVTNPAAPALVGSLAIAGTSKGVDVSGPLAVVAAGTTGVVIVSIANPAAPQRLGLVTTPGDAHKVAIKGNSAFVADYPSSMQVVDFTNPQSPAIIAATQDALGGKLQDIALATISGETFTVGADVFFVNGVPFVDVTQPNNPVPRLILDFRSYRDDNGHGIAVDPSYVYMTGEQASISELGTTGDTRLYIGQYQQIVDNGGVAPAVQITSPSATSVIEGSQVTINVTATDDVAVASVQILVNGQVVLASSAPPFQYSFTAPSSPGSLNIVANAVDYGNNTGTATLNVQVIPDPLTTVTGRIVDSTGQPVAGATVKVFSLTTTSAGDGTFSFTGVPTVSGHIVVQASATPGTAVLAGTSASLIPVGGGTTSAGDITIRPIPVISSLQPNYGLMAHATTVTVTGTQLTNAAFDLPGGGVVSGIVINSDTQATIQITGTNLGNWALIATNPAGSSDTNLTNANQFLVLPSQGAAFVDLSVLNRGWISADIPNPGINISGALSSPVAVLNRAWIQADIPNPGINISGALSNPVAVLNQAWIPADIPNPGINISGALSNPVAVLNQAWISGDIPSAGRIGFAASLVVSVNNTAITTTGTGTAPASALVPSALQTQSARPPSRTIEILNPAESETLLAGQTVPIRVNLPDVTPSGAEFSVNGTPWRATAPLEFLFTAPAGVASVDLRAVVRATDGREWVTPLRHLLIVPDQGQTVSGRVVSEDGRPFPRAPVHIVATGLAAEYFRFDQPLTAWPDLTGRAPDKQSYVSAVNQPNTRGVFGHDPFGTGFAGDYASRLTGRIRARTTGNYIFYLQAHRGSRLLIDGQVLIEIPFVQNDPVESSAVVLLSAGWHIIEVDHFESVGAPSLELSWQRPDSPREVVPQEAFQTDVGGALATDDQGSFSAGPVPLIVAPLSVSTEGRGASLVLNGNLPMERVRQ